MRLRGIVRSASLEEVPPDSGRIEMVVHAQGVGPGQPRTIVVPYELLLQEEQWEPENITGRAFDADVEQADDGRWTVRTIAFASRVLRPPEP